MERIFEPNESFPFEQLVLSTPTFVNSGNYFIKYSFNGSPLYIQPPKCVTKQGIIKGGKKMYCDLLFTNEHESLIQWMENLESYSQNYIFQRRSQWFESELEMHDIENSFTSSMKVFKSGKFYIIRTMIPTRLGKCTLKIFNEEEEEVTLENIKDMTPVVTIWEILGIKCSTRSFQIDIEVKQMMVINPSTLFETCIISTKRNSHDVSTTFPTSSHSASEQSTMIDQGNSVLYSQSKVHDEYDNHASGSDVSQRNMDVPTHIPKDDVGVQRNMDNNSQYNQELFASRNGSEAEYEENTSTEETKGVYKEESPNPEISTKTFSKPLKHEKDTSLEDSSYLKEEYPQTDVCIPIALGTQSSGDIGNKMDVVSVAERRISTHIPKDDSAKRGVQRNMQTSTGETMNEEELSEEDDTDSNEDDSPYEILENEEGLENIPDSSELEIVDLNLQDIQENMDFQLKNRNDVYYEIYEDAKKKAEEARNLAISTYLDAKRIKELYMIQHP
jgi:hypothetical protein